MYPLSLIDLNIEVPYTVCLFSITAGVSVLLLSDLTVQLSVVMSKPLVCYHFAVNTFCKLCFLSCYINRAIVVIIIRAPPAVVNVICQKSIRYDFRRFKPGKAHLTILSEEY